MADFLTNVTEHGLFEGGIEWVNDIFNKGKYQEKAKFKVTDKNGENNLAQNSAAGPIYKTPSGGYSNTRSYAYLTSGADGKLTLNMSRDLYESDAFKNQFLENSTFKEVIKNYQANKNADTVISVSKNDGTSENLTLAQLVKNYNDSLKEFSSAYENYGTIRDEVKKKTGFDLTDDEIRIAANTISDKEEKSDSKVVYLTDDWMNIYDFKSLPSFDADTKTVSAKDFFDVYNLDKEKEKGINEEKWNELMGSANGIVANAYSGNMKRNVEEDAGGDEEAMSKAKDRLVRAIQQSNLLASHDPDQSFWHTSNIVASNTVLSFNKFVLNTVNNIMTAEASVVDSINYGIDMTIASINDRDTYMSTLQGAAVEDLSSGAVNPTNYREYIDGILVSSTDGSMSEVEKVKAEWQAKMAGNQTLTQLVGDSKYNKILETIEAIEWHESYTAQIAPVAAKAGQIAGFGIYTALEIALANAFGSSIEKAIYKPEAAVKTALTTAFGKGLSIGTRLKSLVTLATRNKLLSFTTNMAAQAVIDSLAFEDAREFNKAWTGLEPGDREKLISAFADNFASNSVAEIVGLGGSVVGGAISRSDNKVVQFVSTRMQKAAAKISLPKKKLQMKFADTKIARMLSRPIGKNARNAADLAVKALTNENPNSVFKAATLEEYNIEKARIEYEATKNIAQAKKGVEYVTDFEKQEVKISETTTEAIKGKVSEKTQFLKESARISEGVKSYVREIMGDYSVNIAWKDVTNGAEELQKTLKWSEYNPSANRFLSQDASDYVANKTHYDDLMRKKAIQEGEGLSLSAKEAKKLNELEAWLKDFTNRNGVEAVNALNNFLVKEQALNKALTDWQVRHGVMSKAKYDSLAGTGIFGENDQFYVRTIAMPDGKSMDALEEGELEDKIIYGSDREYMENSGYGSATHDVNTVFEQDLHLSNSIADHYLDPVLTNALTISSIAKAYQGKMWANTLNAIKAPIQAR